MAKPIYLYYDILSDEIIGLAVRNQGIGHAQWIVQYPMRIDSHPIFKTLHLFSHDLSETGSHGKNDSAVIYIKGKGRHIKSGTESAR